MVAHFGYWVKVNIFNYFVVVEGGEQRPPSDIYFIFNYDAPYVIC